MSNREKKKNNTENEAKKIKSDNFTVSNKGNTQIAQKIFRILGALILFSPTILSTLPIVGSSRLQPQSKKIIFV